MFKHNKLFVSVLLVAAIVAGMVIPAFASVTGSGSWNSYSYTWEVYHSTSYGYSKISSSGQPTSFTAKVKNYVTYDLENYKGFTEEASTTGYASVGATVSNIISIRGVKVYSTIKYSVGGFWMGSTCLASNIHAD